MSNKLTNILSIALLGATLVVGYLNFHNYPVISVEGMLVIFIFALTGALVGYAVNLIRSENAQCFLHLFIIAIAIDFNTLLTTKSGWISKLTTTSHSLQNLALVFFSAFFLIILFSLTIRRNLSLILFVSYLVFFTSTLLLPAPSMPFGEQKTNQSTHNNGDLPGTLHLVLDGHIGIAGIPTTIDGGTRLKQRIKAFYKKWDFQLHENAYTQHALTQDSLSTLFNGTSNITETSQLASGHTTGHRYKLVENKYFEEQAQAGYDIRVIQSDYLDFCNSDKVQIAYCYDYPGVSLIKPIIENIETVTNTDIIDSFSTIFAIREPTHAAGSSKEQISLLELFSDYNLIESDLNPQVSGAPIWFRTEDSVADEILRKKYDKLPFD